MKLLFCRNCGDIFNINMKVKVCSCGSTEGRYTDNINATFKGPDAIPLGFANWSFMTAISNKPKAGSRWGERFEAFVIQDECPTFIHTGESHEINQAVSS